MRRDAGVVAFTLGVCLPLVNAYGVSRGVRHPDLVLFDRGEVTADRRSAGARRLAPGHRRSGAPDGHARVPDPRA